MLIFKLQETLFCTVAPLFVLLLSFSLSFFFRNKNSLVDEFNIINAKDVQIIQDKVTSLAKCTHTKTNTIHLTLKKKFNYYSYHFINNHTYKEVILYLDDEINNSCSSSQN